MLEAKRKHENMKVSETWNDAWQTNCIIILLRFIHFKKLTKIAKKYFICPEKKQETIVLLFKPLLFFEYVSWLIVLCFYIGLLPFWEDCAPMYSRLDFSLSLLTSFEVRFNNNHLVSPPPQKTHGKMINLKCMLF